MRLLILLLLPPAAVAASATAVRSVHHAPEILSGAASGKSSAYTWGTVLRRWNPLTLRSAVLARGPFGEGGCTADLDNDGREELLLVRGTGLGKLVWLQPPDGAAEVVDDQVEMHDCLEATLFGRRGILMIQRGIQIRFYERTGPGEWKSRDIYSIYTPSYQTGLALADVNGDGFTDIFAGNYWVQSPGTWAESWRIFAINTWSEEPESAMFRIVLPEGTGSRQIVAQAHASPAKVAVFERHADPKQQWTVRLLAPHLALHNVHALAVSGGLILAGEQNGSASRLLRVHPETGSAEVLARGGGYVAILPLKNGAFLAVEKHGIVRWQQ